MTLQTFIERAIEGGWKPFKTVEIDPRGSWDKIDFEHYGYSAPQNLDKTVASISQYRFLLDPEAWKAVGKVEGWKSETKCPCCYAGISNDGTFEDDSSWLNPMHSMIDALAEGKTIEQFVETL